MKILPGDRMKIVQTLQRVDNLILETKDPRTQLLVWVTMCEALIEHMKRAYGPRKTYEWLQRLADAMIEEDLPQ